MNTEQEKHLNNSDDDSDDDDDENELISASSNIKNSTSTYGAPSLKSIPTSIWFIMGNEGGERFCFYGLRAILVLYLHLKLGYSEDRSTFIFHAYIFAAYFTPLLGGWLADALWGKYLTILRLSLVYLIGILVLTISSVPEQPGPFGWLIGLILISIGTGGIKPNISSFVADQLTSSTQRKALSVTIFHIFYWVINFGSTTSMIVTPLLRRLSYTVAFGIPAVFLVISILIFWIGSPKYVKRSFGSHLLFDFFSVLKTAWKESKAIDSEAFRPAASDYHSGQLYDHWIDTASDKHGYKATKNVKAVYKVIKIFLVLPMFWALFDQTGSRWTLQAKQLNLQLTSSWTLSADQIQVLNPAFLLPLIPVFERKIYPTLAAKGFSLHPIHRIAIGMVLTATSFVLAALLQFSIIRHGVGVVSVLWQIPQYFILTVSEILISITGLEFAYSQAPKSMKSVVMSFWLLTNSFGNLFTAIIAESNFLPQAYEFLFFAFCMFICLGIFIWIGQAHIASEAKNSLIQLPKDSDDNNDNDNDNDNDNIVTTPTSNEDEMGIMMSSID